MTYLTSSDLLIRQQLILQKIAELGNTYANDLRWGRNCSLNDRNKLILLEALYDLILNYPAYNCDNDNCLDNDKILPLLDFISSTYNIYFPVIGSMPDDGFRITTNNCLRVTTDNNERIYI